MNMETEIATGVTLSKVFAESVENDPIKHKSEDLSSADIKIIDLENQQLYNLRRNEVYETL